MADVILLHGAAGRKEEMHPLSYTFGGGITAWSLDLLGHGERPMPDAFGLREMTEDIIAGLDQAGLEKVYVLGHSFGGYIGLLLASRFPDRIAGCCTLAAHLVYDRRAVRQALLILNKERLTQFERENEPWTEAVFDRLRLMLRTVEANGDAIYEDHLRSLKVPVLAMGGDRDPLVNAEHMEQLASIIPRFRCAVFAGSAHPLREAPIELVSGAVSDFIRDVEAGAI